MKKARAMYIPAGEKKAVWGPVDQNVLPEGYPYKSIGPVTIEEAAIAKNGVFANNFEIIVGNEYTVTFDGVTYNLVAFDDGGYPTIGAPYNDFSQYPFGIYSADDTVSLSVNDTNEHNISVVYQSETIHPMAPEFLPAGVGVDFVINARTDYHNQVSADKTYDEVLAALQSGKTAVVYMTDPMGMRSKSVGCSPTEDGGIGFLFLGATVDSAWSTVCTPDGWTNP